MRTIRQQLTSKLLVGFAVPLVVGGLAVFLLTREALLEQFDATLRAEVTAIVSAARQDHGMITFTIPSSLEQDTSKHPSFFQIWQTDGTTLRRSGPLRAPDLPMRYGSLERPKFWNLTLPSRVAGRAIGVKFIPKPTLTEVARSAPLNAVLVVASDTDEMDDALEDLALALIGCGAALLAITVVIVPRLLRRQLAPLDQLAERAVHVDADSLATRFPTDGLPGELAPISSRLNELLARLERSFQRERQFSADLAHELRTPIAELRSLAEVALKWPDAREAATDREILAIALQMEGIVTRLLTLLRGETGQLLVTTDRVAIAPLIQSAWMSCAERVADKRLIVTTNAPDSIQVQTDPVLLRSILTNLIDNAVEYTPHGGSIAAACTTENGRFTLSITNTAVDLNAEDVSHLFERFWRKESARSDSKHAGLGLSIVRTLCDCLGWQPAAELLDPSTLSIRITGVTDASHQSPQ
ncbi:MAG TPA: ATP-binding protein [Verrucomicrobiae bacterium]|nr:ATP-binding protein [Verrucomicrobiae bacterium]